LDASIVVLAQNLNSKEERIRNRAAHLIFSRLSTLLVAENFEDEVSELTARLTKLQENLSDSKKQNADEEDEEFDDDNEADL